jgi:hypothetical protein
MYFGVNLILMLDYRLSFDIDVKNGEGIEVLIQAYNSSPMFNNDKSNLSVCFVFLSSSR